MNEQSPRHVVLVDDLGWMSPEIVRVAFVTDEELSDLLDGALDPADLACTALADLLRPVLADGVDDAEEV